MINLINELFRSSTFKMCNLFADCSMKPKISGGCIDTGDESHSEMTLSEILASMTGISNSQTRISEKRFSQEIVPQNGDIIIRSTFLETTTVFQNTRGQLIDWLSIVCKKTSQSNETFFRTVELFNEVSNMYSNQLFHEQMILLMTSCLFICSKLEEVIPLELDMIVRDVCHRNFTREDILVTESVILSKIKYKIPRNCALDLIYDLISKTFSESNGLMRETMYAFALLFYRLYSARVDALKNFDISGICCGILYYTIYYTSNSLKINKQEKLMHLTKHMKSYAVNANEIFRVFSLLDSLIQNNNISNFPYIQAEIARLASSILKS